MTTKRMLGEGFWSDGDLLRWPLPKRLLYAAGMPALADVTGCLEDDPWAWKLQLFPSPVDAGITVDVLEAWRDELIAEGKVLPYEVEGKRYLYLPRFHRHQHLTNVSAPRIPWPADMIAVRPHETDSRKYVVHDAITGAKLQPSKAGETPPSVRVPLPQVVPVASREGQSNQGVDEGQGEVRSGADAGADGLDQADERQIVQALLDRFSSLKRHDVAMFVAERITSAYDLECMREAVSRTLQRARQSPLDYLEKAFRSVKAGD